MKETPALMRGDMVRATLADLKSKTRRVMIPQIEEMHFTPERDSYFLEILQSETDPIWWTAHYTMGEVCDFKCPYGHAGDRLWVREAWAPGEDEDGPFIWYAADDTKRHDFIELSAGFNNKWSSNMRENCDGRCTLTKPSIHMPRWACRLILEITHIGVERLQDITEEEAIAEGIERNCDPEHPEKWDESDGWCSLGHPDCDPDLPPVFDPVQEWFKPLWNSINEARGHSWISNPWVWVITFKKVENE